MQWGNNSKEGETFKGIWSNDNRIKGYLKMVDGSEYEGDWRGDVFHGDGRLTFKPEKKGENGVVYEGQFKNGMQDREGKLYFSNGDFYQGQTLDNKKQGRGVLRCGKTGNLYDCMWEEDKKQGLGIVLYKNGDFFKGEF